MKRRGLSILTLVAATVLGLPMNVVAQSGEENIRPRLVVSITIEGLDEQYLELLSRHFTDKGFNYLREQGVTITDVTYGPGVDATAATAMIYTGAPALVTGIPSATIYDSERKTSRRILTDAAGNFTLEPLAVSTISDEVRISEGGINTVYSLAGDPQQAILMGGHASNAALWISDINGNWTTAPFYREAPTNLSMRNMQRPLSQRLDTLKWSPSMEVSQYPGIPTFKRQFPFRHLFQNRDRDRYRAFKVSAPGNREVTTYAVELMNGQGLGTHDVTDMINLSYTLAPYPYSRDADSRLEVLDAYLRLDTDLSSIVKAIENGPGMEHTMIMVVGTPAPASGKRDEERFGIPYGQFSARKAMALLNMFLIAQHGNGDWVSGFHNGQFYLNRTLIRDRGKDLAEIRREVADFLTRMSGVCEAWTIEDITAGRSGTNVSSRNVSPTVAGDVFITVAPGWETIEDDSMANELPRAQVSRLGAVSSPAYIVAPGLSPKRIDTRVDACVIAPTVCRLLRIRSPNAASQAPLRLE